MAQGKLQEKVAVVTGGGSGIGRAIVLRFASEGARVALLDVSLPESEAVAREVEAAGGSATVFRCDVTRQAEVLETFRAVETRLGPVDILVNNAGIAHIGSVEKVPEEDFDRVYSVNVKGVYNCLKAAVATMKGRGGVIVNMASILSVAGVPDRFAYSMSKGAVLTMTYSVACDYVKQGIRCNAISPARVHTPFVDGYLAKHYPGREAEMFETLSQTQPIGRMGSPEEVAGMALYLCSDEASFITGSNFLIDGGFVNLNA